MEGFHLFVKPSLCKKTSSLARAQRRLLVKLTERELESPKIHYHQLGQIGLLTVVSHYEINYEKTVKAYNPVSSIQKHTTRREQKIQKEKLKH